MASLDETLEGLIIFKMLLESAESELQINKTKLAGYNEGLKPILKQEDSTQLFADVENLQISLERLIEADMGDLSDFLKGKISVLEEYLEL